LTSERHVDIIINKELYDFNSVEKKNNVQNGQYVYETKMYDLENEGNIRGIEMIVIILVKIKLRDFVLFLTKMKPMIIKNLKMA
jgi:hypothetical protein